ncbi:MAG: hypothetical protein M1835_004735 [Candelina submexicana]|nr:MAG: hypothetical protein M1835_004735 [Candelina submexicana]
MRTSIVHDDVSWIRDLLPVDLPQARLLYFNYDSTTYNDAPIKILEDIADELLLAFNEHSLRLSQEERKRPVIFLCHSYGGLVVKEALIRAQSALERHSDIVRNTYGVLFLGTPHLGTQYTGYARAVAVRLSRLDSNPDIFLPLEVNSTRLLAQHETFLWYYDKLPMVNFYETHKLEIYNTWFWHRPYRIMVSESAEDWLHDFDLALQIVDKFSATFDAPNITNSPRDTDHSGLNKFSIDDDYNYVRALRALRTVVRKIIDDRQGRRVAEEAREAAERKTAMMYSNSDFYPLTKHYIVHPQTVASYTERHEIMSQLEDALNTADMSRSPPRSVALWGAGGAGKSQLALRYAEKNRLRYDPIIWIDASTPETAIKSYSKAFEDLALDFPHNYIDERRRRADNGEAIQLLLYGFGPYEGKDAIEGSSLAEVRIHVPSLQQATRIVDALDNSALLIHLANRYILQHHNMRENLSLYLGYHDEMSFNLLDNAQLGLQDHYRFTLASVYETSLAAARNISADSTTLLSLFTFLNGGDGIEDRLFREAVLGLAENEKYRSTQHLFSEELQWTLFGLCSGGTFLLLSTCRRHKTHLSGRTMVIARVAMLILPALAGAFFIIGIRFVQRSKFGGGDVTKPVYLVDRSMTSELIISNVISIYYLFFDRFFQSKDVFWLLRYFL